MSWQDFLTALGLVAVLEGLVLALAPLRLEEMLEVLRSIPPSTRRGIGLGIVAFGVALLWIVRG